MRSREASQVTGTQHLVQDRLAIAAEVVPAASVSSEKLLTKIIRGRSLARLAFQLFGYRISHKVGESDASLDKARP
jgi:hypothetical protein